MGIDATGYFLTKRCLTDDEIVKMNAELVEFHPRLHRNPPKESYDAGPWFQRANQHDGLPENAIEIDFGLGRFYGPFYERGDFMEYLTVLGWLRRRDYVTAVFYGGDSTSLDEISEWDEARERDYIEHYLSVGERPYRSPSNWTNRSAPRYTEWKPSDESTSVQEQARSVEPINVVSEEGEG